MTTATIPHPDKLKHKPPKEQFIYRHYFAHDKHWYLAGEYSHRVFFGYVNLGAPELAEWGDFSQSDLDAWGAIMDHDWTPRLFGEIEHG